MEIRHYRPGDEAAQAAIYNAEAVALPGFRPANAEEVARRYRASDPDPDSKLYAVDGERVVGYAVFNPDGRISYPWCLPGAGSVRGPLLAATLAAMARRGLREAWAAYRGDWAPIQSFFDAHGFAESRRMVNFVADLGRLPRTPAPDGWRFRPMTAADLPRVVSLGGGLFGDDGPRHLDAYFRGHPHLDPSALFVLERGDGSVVGAASAVTDPSYADPAKLDASMPCFRLGTFGTESGRHKRVNGLVSCVFDSETVGEALLAEAARRFEAAGLARAAAQAPSDRPDLIAFSARYFDRQGDFPIRSRRLDSGDFGEGQG